MTSPDRSQCELIDQLAEEFVQRYRRGERPPLKEYLDKYPELANDIRALFPALVEMEQVKADPGTTTASVELPPLRQIGDYRIVREVGRGAMGVVYEAEQLSLGRRVALKVLSARVAPDPQSLERFRREARSAAKLHHTNIVPVFEVGQDGDICYYAMQFIHGQSLDQIIEELSRLRRRAFPSGESPFAEMGKTQVFDAHRPAVDQLAHSLLTDRFHIESAMALVADGTEEHQPVAKAAQSAVGERGRDSTPSTSSRGADATALADTSSSAVLPGQTELSSVRTDRPHYFQSVARIGYQVAYALAYAHARNVIHRDIKPSNLLLDVAGVVWIADFGLAKTQEGALTNSGDVVGTLRYMAPERFRGEGDERSDVYALGLTLYEMLVLRPAFGARDRLQLIDHIKNQDPIRPRLVDRSIPRNLETIVLTAVHKEPKRRYQTAEAMAEDLRRFLADEPIKAKQTGHLARLRLWSRRNPELAALWLVLALVAAGATATAFYLKATLLHVEEAELDGKHKLWLSYLSQAQARRMSRQPGQRFASLRAIQAALALPVHPDYSRDELRTEAIAALCLPDLEFAWKGRDKPLGASGFAIDSAFQRYAWGEKDGAVHICRLSDDKELLQLPGDGPVDDYGGLQFSPDGRFLHQFCNTARGPYPRLWDLDASKLKAVLEDDHNGLAFRPDGREFAVSYRNRTVRFFETASGRELRRFTLDITPDDRGLIWNPKLPQLLFSQRNSLHLLNVDTGTTRKVGPKVPGGYASVAWHPEGRLLAVSGELDRKIYLWDVPSAHLVIPPLDDHKHRGVVMRFNHAGDRLLSTDWSGSGHLWDVRSGRLLLTLPGFAVDLYFRADDRLVATREYSTGTAHLYHFRRGEELRTLVHHETSSGYGNKVCLDAQGRFCAIGIEKAGVALVDIARGEETALLPLPGNGPLRFDSEGALWTYDSAGLLRWPAADDPQTGQRRYGPPKQFYGRTNGDLHGSSTDAQLVAIPNYGRGALIFHRDSERVLPVGPQEDVRNCAVSPDGRWIATGSHTLREGCGAKIWDAQEGRFVQDLPVLGLCGVCFSPDGKWLLTSAVEGPRLWAAGTWEEGPKLNGDQSNRRGAFSHDSTLLALGDKPGVIRLIVPDTGKEIARLTAPEQARLEPCCFTPDGTQLIAAGSETTTLHIFDLRAIREGLAELNLDWAAPPLPVPSRGADATPLPPSPLAIHFDLGDVREWAKANELVQQALVQTDKKEHTKALAALRKAVELAPRYAMAQNNLAWLLLTGPKELREPAKALSAARKAVELGSNQSSCLNTLGVALYRTGQYADAIPVLERSLREQRGQADAFDLFFLAMCHHHLGDPAKAKQCYTRACDWFQEHKGKLPRGWSEELTAFQDEAETVLSQTPGPAKK
jgi:serine/threonine protein kinase/WD40 repeat protein